MQETHTQHTLKEKQRLEREKFILQAAEDAFLEKGFHDTSMDEIAARVGIAKGTVYLHFACKEDLVIALFKRNMQQGMEHLDTVISSEVGAEAKLKAVIKYMYTGLYSKQAQLLNSIYSGTNLQKLFKEKGEPVHESWSIFIQRISALLEEGKQQGEFDPSLSTPVMTLAFANMFSPRPTNKFILNEDTLSQETIDQLERIYFAGIKAKN